jgi:hypothetical protein
MSANLDILVRTVNDRATPEEIGLQRDTSQKLVIKPLRCCGGGGGGRRAAAGFRPAALEEGEGAGRPVV